MFKKAFVFAVTAACLSAGAAHAQSYGQGYDQRAQYSDRSGYDNDGDRYRRGERNEYSDRNDYRRDRYDGYRYDTRHDGYREHRRDDRRYGYDSRDYRYSNDGWRNGGYEQGRRHYLRRGERLAYGHGGGYVVSDWHRHRGLYAPQRGYQWVQVGTDYALVAIATGIIAQVLLN